MLRPQLYVNFRLWNQQSNDPDNEEVFLKTESYFNISINRNVETGAIKSKKIWNNVYLHFDSRFEWPSCSLPHQGTRGRYHGTVSHIGIHADGTVVPCCPDKNAAINLGNVKEQPLTEILGSERFQKMRAGFLMVCWWRIFAGIARLLSGLISQELGVSRQETASRL